MVSRWWWDLTTVDFAGLDRERTVAVLPVGAVEQHGPHLPVGVDAAINAGIIARAVELLPQSCPALVLPLTPVGKSDEHLSFPGTLTLSHETLGRVWYELGASVHRAGLRKILFFNSHGGQPQVAEIVCRDLRVKLGMFAASAMWPQLIDMTDLFDAAEIKHGIHAGQIETSMMLHLQPELVDMARAENFTPTTVEIERDAELLGRGAAYFGWQAQDLHLSGASGNAAKATAELGKELVERAAGGLVKLVEEISHYPLTRLRTHTAFDGAGREYSQRNSRMPFSVAALAQAKAFRISPKDTNYFVMLFDQATDAINNIFVVEIFRPGGATPPNEHAAAHEFFHVLHGEGIARCDGKILPIRKGDSLLLHPGSEHVIENTGAGKLYTLTVMTPNEGFSELIRGGDPVELDAEDIRILGGL